MDENIIWRGKKEGKKEKQGKENSKNEKKSVHHSGPKLHSLF